MDVFWFIPTHGDSRYLGTSLGAREAGYDYFRQVAVAADTLGYDGVLLPTGRSCEDAWVVASSLIGATSRLKFLVAIRPGVSSPQFSARMAATFDRLSQGRLLVNVVTGGDPGELEGDGVFVSHDERYAITADYLKIWRGILAASHEGAGYSHDGEKLVSKGGKVLYPPAEAVSAAVLRRLVRGRARAGGRAAGRVPDLGRAARGRSPQDRRRARARGAPRTQREVRHPAARDRARDRGGGLGRRRRADQPSERGHGERRAGGLRQDGFGRPAAHGRAAWRQARRWPGRPLASGDCPHLWAGVGLVRGGAGTALVGDPQTVAARIQEYAELGIDTFIFSGYPHLEESYRFAELVFPLLPGKGRGRQGNPVLTGPFGEVMATELVPKVAAS